MHPPAGHTQPRTTVPGMDAALGRLARLRTLIQTLLILQRLGWIAAGLIALTVAAAFVDYFLRSPGWMRGIALFFGLSLCLELLRRRILPALRFSPSLEDLALRVERSDAGRSAGLSGVAASGVGFALAPAPDQPAIADTLTLPVQSEAARRLRGLGIFRFIQWRPVFISSATAAVALFAVLALLAAQPRMTWIGAVRILAPWSGVEWPKHADVEDATHARFHALGTALPLRAGVLSESGDASQDQVEARYRLIVDGAPGPVRRILLARQDRTESITLTNERGERESVPFRLFESLIEPAALAPDASAKPSAVADAELEYWFTTTDDATEPRRIRLVAPTAVVAASAAITPPAYAAAHLPARTQDLGPGNDERATLAGVLPGSRIDLTIRLNKPVPMPGPASDDAARAGWLSAAFGPDAAGAVLSSASAASDAITISITPDKSLRLLFAAADEFGIRPAEETAFRIDAAADRPPEAAVTRPAENADVLSTSLVEVTAEGRDDVGLAWVAAEYRLARRAAGSEGAQPEAAEQYTQASRAQPVPADHAARTLTSLATLDLSAIGAKPGDELWITSLAADNFSLNDKSHDPVRSPIRKIRIISEDQLVEQIWSELGGVRRQAIRQAETLQRLQQDVSRGRDADSAAREQASVSETAARMAETVARARQRSEQNALRDADLNDVLREARDLIERARDQSAKAQDALRRAAEADRARDPASASRSRNDARQAQEQAEAAMERLAEALDRGQDAWSSRRSLERLIRDQQSLRDSTSSLEQSTTGKPADELSPAERQQAERLAQEQEALARRAEEAIRQMLERAEQMRQSDPPTAQALQQAANRGQRSAVQEMMQQIAQQIRKNQQRSAGQQQEQAQRSLQNMLDELKDSARNRDEVLRRELASLIQTIEALIARQRECIDALAAARPGGNLAGLDLPMVRLHTATLAALDQARGTGREVKPVADHIDGAQEAQARTVTSLRAQPADADEADRQEAISLKRLTLAKQEAEKAQRQAQQREQERQRAELKQAYRELVLEQTELRRTTQDLVGQPADRRTRARLRELADRQDALRIKARALLDSHEELKESELFTLSHDRLDKAADDAARPMRDAVANALVISHQSVALRTLQGLLDALEEADRQDEPFRQPEGDNSGQTEQGQQKPKLIPDIAELKRLRGLQEEALLRTRESAEAADPAVAKAAADDAAQLQAALVKKAQTLIQKLQQRPGMPGGGGQ